MEFILKTNNFGKKRKIVYNKQNSNNFGKKWKIVNKQNSNFGEKWKIVYN